MNIKHILLLLITLSIGTLSSCDDDSTPYDDTLLLRRIDSLHIALDSVTTVLEETAEGLDKVEEEVDLVGAVASPK